MAKRDKEKEREERVEELSSYIRYLFPDGVSSAHQLSMVTRTPPHLIMSLVRARLVTEALNEHRKESLLSIFLNEFDRRMISKGGEGRKEFIDMAQSENKANEDELEL